MKRHNKAGKRKHNAYRNGAETSTTRSGDLQLLDLHGYFLQRGGGRERIRDCCTYKDGDGQQQTCKGAFKRRHCYMNNKTEQYVKDIGASRETRQALGGVEVTWRWAVHAAITS